MTAHPRRSRLPCPMPRRAIYHRLKFFEAPNGDGCGPATAQPRADPISSAPPQRLLVSTQSAIPPSIMASDAATPKAQARQRLSSSPLLSGLIRPLIPSISISTPITFFI